MESRSSVARNKLAHTEAYEAGVPYCSYVVPALRYSAYLVCGRRAVVMGCRMEKLTDHHHTYRCISHRGDLNRAVASKWKLTELE